MKKTLRLNRWALVGITAALLGISVLSTTVLANTDTIGVKADVLNVRLGPGLSYNVMGQMQKGSTLTVIGQKNSWYQVRLAGNKIGWVASWLVEHNAATTTNASVALASTSLAVRQYGSSTAKQLGSLSAGSSVKILYTQGSWSQIEYKGGAGWVHSAYLTKTGQTAAVTTTQSQLSNTSASANLKVRTNTATNLRDTGGINASIVAKLAKNTELTVLSQDGEWYRVRTSAGKTGFVASWVVSTPSNGSTNKAATSLAEATIVIDPGHGGSDVGASSTSGKYEKTYTLETADKIASQLRAAGANVVMTRTTDTYVDLSPRPTLAAKLHADAFISIHFDSTADANSASGHTTYYYSKSKDLALANALSKATSSLPVSSRGVAFGNYEVLRDNTQPSVLLELGYINSKTDFAHISSSSYQEKVAADVRAGLNQYFAAGNHQ
jgi:N-acetylmuramoyl-L-alanine amidase